ncbi:aminopeptidase [Tribonema minus]|uniref:Aminopeptidase n=1 Tax=Tribonema minus TaxID=303371 RepID=A0A835ZE57_9STRA|nr:aminopeptidase [Tribonema minus]
MLSSKRPLLSLLAVALSLSGDMMRRVVAIAGTCQRSSASGFVSGGRSAAGVRQGRNLFSLAMKGPPRAVYGSRVGASAAVSMLGSPRLFSLSRAATLRAGGGLATAAAALMSTASPVAAEAQAAPKEKFRKDYMPLERTIQEVQLDFNLQEEGGTIVTAKLTMSAPSGRGGDVFLDGEELELVSVAVDGKPLHADVDYKATSEGLTLMSSALPADRAFELSTAVRVKPELNTKLSGLYKSGGMFCTQCEAEGFRRITYYQDRPDVMARFTRVRVEGNKNSVPVLLSNGNKVEEGDLGDGRHYAVWEDPFPKPSYLFALVAGDLGSIKSQYKTMSGRDVKLEIFSEKENVDKLDWAMDSLKASMKWDEDTYGLEYDLDLFNIVAVNDFNMGAMENKGLNVFNTAYVLAKPDTATDLDYERVEGVIGHEYFHNWTGNRVTCRDWFQLTLKEGLTVFRDQQFSAYMGSDAVKRIEDVRGLRARQFPEDSSPLAHPIRPEQYQVMDNFYTSTVYQKGAEVIRMYHTLLGTDGFRKGMDLYFKRHDGQAVTCDDFRAAMADANNVDLSQFERWYLQAGTPTLEATGTYDADAKTFSLKLKQASHKLLMSTLCPECTKPTPNQEHKDPFHIPVKVGLLLRDGSEVVPSKVLELKEAEQTFTFDNIPSEPVPSILRGFSAPVKLRYEYSDEDLAFLMTYDTDSFNRWEAGQQLAQRLLLSLTKKAQTGESLPELPKVFLDSFKATLLQDTGDKSLQAYALSLPSSSTLAEEMDVIDPDALGAAAKHVRTSIATALMPELKAKYESLAPSGPYQKTGEEVGRRRLRNTILDYIHSLKDDAAADLCFKQYESADCMTDKVAALSCLADIPGPKREAALESFYQFAKSDALVLNKWFSLQASSDLPDVLDRVKALVSHPDFTLKNPNRLRSLVSVFAANMTKFHAKSGAAYAFLGDMCLQVDQINAQVASRLVGSLSQWRRFDAERQALMKEQLLRIRDAEGISKDTYEVAARCLG